MFLNTRGGCQGNLGDNFFLWVSYSGDDLVSTVFVEESLALPGSPQYGLIAVLMDLKILHQCIGSRLMGFDIRALCCGALKLLFNWQLKGEN